MTNKKTIEIMQDMKNHAERTDDKELMDACDGAIKALEENRKLKEAVGKIRERVQYASEVCGYINFSQRELLEIIDKNTEGLL